MKKKIIYLKLVCEPSVPFLLCFKTLNVSIIIVVKNKTKKIASTNRRIWRLKSFNSIKLWFIKVKNVNNPNIIQIRDDVITHL